MSRVILAIFGLIILLNASDIKIGQILADLKRDDIKGDFKQTKNIGSQKLIFEGDFVIENNAFIQDIKKPVKLKSRIDENGFWRFNNEWIKSDGGFDKGIFLAIIRADLDSLKGDFEVDFSGDKNSWEVNLTPKGLIKKIFKNIKISGDGVVKKIELNEINGDFTIYEFMVKQ